MSTIEDKITAAEAAATKANEKAEQLRRERAEAEAAEKARKRAARAQFEAQREREFPQRYARPAREARAAFEAAVTGGGDVFGTWLAYQNAQAVARAELDIIEQFTRVRVENDRRVWAKRCEEWSRRISDHLGTYPTGPHPTLEAINAEINEATAQAPRPASRQHDDHTSITPVDLGVKSFTSDAPRFTDDDLAAAINRAITRATEAAVRRHQKERGATVAEL